MRQPADHVHLGAHGALACFLDHDDQLAFRIATVNLDVAEGLHRLADGIEMLRPVLTIKLTISTCPGGPFRSG